VPWTRWRGDGDGTAKVRGMAMTGRTAAYGRAVYTWAMKRGALSVNPFAALPISKSIAKRERCSATKNLPKSGVLLLTLPRPTVQSFGS
jgi:hypothetical protein